MNVIIIYSVTLIIIWLMVILRIRERSIVSQRSKCFSTLSKNTHKYYFIIKDMSDNLDSKSLLKNAKSLVYQVSPDTYIVCSNDLKTCKKNIEKLDCYNAAVYISRGEVFTPDDLFNYLFRILNKSRRKGLNSIIQVDFDKGDYLDNFTCSINCQFRRFEPILKDDKLIGISKIVDNRTIHELFPPSIFLPTVIKDKIRQSLSIKCISDTIKSLPEVTNSETSNDFKLILKIADGHLDQKFVWFLLNEFTDYQDELKNNIVFEFTKVEIANEYIPVIKSLGFKIGAYLTLDSKDIVLSNEHIDCLKIDSKMINVLSSSELEMILNNHSLVIGSNIEDEKQKMSFLNNGIKSLILDGTTDSVNMQEVAYKLGVM